MRMNFLLLITSLTILFFDCANKNQEKKPYEMEKSSIINIELENVSFVKVNKGGNEYEIRNTEKLSSNLTALKKSHIKYVKFGSKNSFTIYDTNENIVIEGSFKDDIFKIKGVVYQANQSLFE